MGFLIKSVDETEYQYRKFYSSKSKKILQEFLIKRKKLCHKHLIELINFELVDIQGDLGYNNEFTTEVSIILK